MDQPIDPPGDQLSENLDKRLKQEKPEFGHAELYPARQRMVSAQSKARAAAKRKSGGLAAYAGDRANWHKPARRPAKETEKSTAGGK